jgi:SAM-dependent methyltransferase
MDPRRLLGRYVVTNLKFAYLIAKERVADRSEARRHAQQAPRRRGVDRVIRRSWIGRRVGSLRHASPRLYTALRAVYRRFESRGKLDGLDPYQRNAVETFLRETAPELLDAGVLEVGSDTSGHVLRHLNRRGVTALVGVNPAWTDGDLDRLQIAMPSVRVLALDLLSAKLPAASFGAIFSVAVFEHLIDLVACLDEMHRLLLPGGRVFAAFGPIWSSSLGHHVFVDRDDVQLRHWDPRLNPIDDYSHLLMSPDEMHAHIQGRRNHATADAAVDWIYRSDELNRRFFDDYVAAFEASQFRVLSIETDDESVPHARLEALRSRYPGKTTFTVRNATVVLEKGAGRGVVT